MVMGSVAFIEERQKFNMGLGIPAGSFSVIAAGEFSPTAYDLLIKCDHMRAIFFVLREVYE